MIRPLIILFSLGAAAAASAHGGPSAAVPAVPVKKTSITCISGIHSFEFVNPRDKSEPVFWTIAKPNVVPTYTRLFVNTVNAVIRDCASCLLIEASFKVPAGTIFFNFLLRNTGAATTPVWVMEDAARFLESASRGVERFQNMKCKPTAS